MFARLKKDVGVWKRRLLEVNGVAEANPSGNPPGRMRIPTTVVTSTSDFNIAAAESQTTIEQPKLSSHFNTESLPSELLDSITTQLSALKMAGNNIAQGSHSLNKLAQQFWDFLNTDATLQTIETYNNTRAAPQRLKLPKLLAQIPKKWTLYHPLVMLPPGATTKDWAKLLEASSKHDVNNLYQKAIDVFSSDKEAFTHLAVNKGIPLENNDSDDNTLRTPTELQMLFGDFGPDIETARFYLSPDAPHLIGKEDFDNAFWVTAKQNRITQVWAPRWTMFSRGNVKEKARVLGFEPPSAYRSYPKPAQAAATRQITNGEAEVGDNKGRRMSLDGEKAEKDVAMDLGALDGTNEPMGDITNKNFPSAPRETKKLEKLRPAGKSGPGLITVTEPIPIDSSPEALDNPQPRPSFMPPPAPTTIPTSLPVSQPTNNHLSTTASTNPKPENKFSEVQLAVDLYAGIGYFTFSYLTLGYDVIAYELNPFSIEGLRRGAKENWFECTVLRGKGLLEITNMERQEKWLREYERDREREKGTERKEELFVRPSSEKQKKRQVAGERDMKIVEAKQAKTTKRQPDVIIDDDETLFISESPDGPPVNPSQHSEPSDKSNPAPPRKQASESTESPYLPTTNKLTDIEAMLQNQGLRPQRAIVYEQSNEHAFTNFLALSTMRGNCGGNPYRIRHINLGFLPSSSGSWDTAAQLISTNIDGGFIHVHENAASGEIEEKGEEVRGAFEELLNPYQGNGCVRRRVELGHTELVKTFAPGVWHVVFDVRVGKARAASQGVVGGRVKDRRFFEEVQ